MLTSEILNKAADAIEREGWNFGEGWADDNAEYRLNSGLCLEGGIVAAMQEAGMEVSTTHDMPAFQACPAYQAVRSYLVESDRLDPEADVWEFNDSFSEWEEDSINKILDDRNPGKAEVISVLRAVALVESVKEKAHVNV